MVSPLWKACSDGDLETVFAIFNDPAPVDLELKDHTGATPLIEAIKGGHIEVIRALLNKGANPSNGSNEARPEQFTSDPAIHELLRSYYAPASIEPGHENVYANGDPSKAYYALPPPGAYPYYPSINPAMSPMGEGGVYYPQHPPQPSQETGENSPTSAGIGHLPPPEVARLIPCRYFPACRYGPQCMFAHPRGPYYPNNSGPPPPPQQYPPFDPAMGNPYAYYPPPSYQQPNGAPMSPPPHVMHGRSPSELVSPSQSHFPNGGPPPPPPMGPYGPISPSNYPHPGQVPVPMSLPPPPPMHHQPSSGHIPHSPTTMYNNAPVPFPGPDGQQYFAPPPMGYPDMDGKISGPNGQPDGFSHPGPRDNNGPRRGGGGGGVRRGSFVKTIKPPCMFFPSGRCKNGDDCRFPHVLSENPGPNHPHNFYPPRGGAPRPPRGPNHVNGVTAINQKMGNMTVRDDSTRPQNGATEGSSRSQSTDGNRPKHQQGPNKHQNGANGKRPNLNFAPIRPQRVPSAEDFPVLPGLCTSPKRNGINGLPAANGLSGPTAAQILLAPPPIRKENSRDSSTSGIGSVRGPSPETAQTPEEPKPDVVKAVVTAPEGQVAAVPAPAPPPASAPAPAPISPVPQKLPISFAAAAAAAAAPELSKEVSISA